MLATLALSPGLKGQFHFDDYSNLDSLGKFGAVDSLQRFALYITSGTADPAGRPLSLLTFLLDARNWPAEPFPFLRTNLLLHLLNGCLLYQLLVQLERWGTQQVPTMLPVLAAGLWLVHPLFVSTVFYVVQREAMLPATFVLLGLISFLSARRKFEETNGRRGATSMIVSVFLFTTLATLSKANGILLPLLVATVDLCYVRAVASVFPTSTTNKLNRTRLIYAGVPAIVIIWTLVRPLGGFFEPLPARGWSIAQRVLTEPRILLDYLALLAVPRSVSNGLFNDAYPLSTGIFAPPSTALALLLISITVVVFVKCAHSKKLPRLTTAIFFFLAGHLLESTTIPLELYFEHRNYLPALLLYWPVSFALFHSRLASPLRTATALCLLLLFAATAHVRSSLWASPLGQSLVGAEVNDSSPRAQTVAAIAELDSGRVEAAIHRLESLQRIHPADLQIAFNLVDARCVRGGLSPSDAAETEFALKNAKTGALLMSQWLSQAIQVASEQTCAGLSLPVASRWVHSVAANSRANDPRDIEPLLAQIEIARNAPDAALDHFNKSLALTVAPGLAAAHAANLAEHGYYRQALAHLDYYERIADREKSPGWNMARLHKLVLRRQHYWDREIALLRSKLETEIREEHATQ